MNILTEIANYTKERIARQKQLHSLGEVRSRAEALAKDKAGKSFRQALAAPGLSVIAELKAASPSKGIIAQDFASRYLQQAKAYAAGGAAAISCLTEPKYFLGSDEYLRQVRQTVELPLLRKDFTIDEYMVYEAKSIGADAVLLICSLLSGAQLAEYLALAKELGMDALVEAHDAKELERAVLAKAEIIGVNNRDLQDFSINMGNSLKLRQLVPQGISFVAESGIKSLEDIRLLQEAGVDGVLIGELLMSSKNPGRLLQAIRGVKNEG